MAVEFERAEEETLAIDRKIIVPVYFVHVIIIESRYIIRNP